MVLEGGLQLCAALLEESKLMSRELVETIAVGAYKMGEHRTRYDGVLMLQTVYQLLHVVLGVEAQPVHAGVELYVYGESCHALTLCCLDKSIEQTERVDLRLKVIVEHCLEGRHLRVHNHDV